MSDPGDALTSAMQRHRASIEAAKAISARIAAERESAMASGGASFTVPNGVPPTSNESE